jgi:hypothetical protein
MNLRTASFAVALCALANCAVPGHASLIVNGGFESPPVAPGNFLTVNPGQEAGDGFTGWTVTTGNVDVVNATAPLFGINWGAQASIDGAQILDLNGNTEGGIAQSFATVAGLTYTLALWYANNPLGPGGTAQIALMDVGTTNASLLSAGIAHNTSNPSTPDWKMYTGTFVARGPLSSLAITSTSGPGDPSGGVVLDAISVALPEPASIALVAIALAVLPLMRRRHPSSTREA